MVPDHLLQKSGVISGKTLVLCVGISEHLYDLSQIWVLHVLYTTKVIAIFDRTE